MSVSELITLGIGTPSNIPHFLLTGLGPGTEPPFQDIVLGTIQIGQPTLILNSVTAPANGQAFALPAYSTKITWQTVPDAGGTEISLQVSLDGTHWGQIDSSTSTTSEVKSVNVSAAFLRAVGVTGANLSVTVIALREKL